MNAAADSGRAAAPRRGGGVAVIIALERAEDLSRTLESLAGQALAPARLIAVLAAEAGEAKALQPALDAAGFPKETQTEIAADPKLRGAAGCWNEGLQRIGECEYAYFLKPGYFPDRYFLRQAAGRLDGQPSAAAASADYLRETEETQTLETASGLEWNDGRWIFRHGADLIPRTLFRSAAALSFRGFNPEVGNGRDLEFCLQVARRGEWLHAGDCAVVAVDEEYARSADRADERDRDFALLCEMHFDNLDFRGRIPPSIYRPLFARHWRRAAQWFLAVRRFDDARDCLRRSLAWRILGNSALWRLALAGLFRSEMFRGRLENLRRRMSTGRSPLPGGLSFESAEREMQ